MGPVPLIRKVLPVTTTGRREHISLYLRRLSPPFFAENAAHEKNACSRQSHDLFSLLVLWKSLIHSFILSIFRAREAIKCKDCLHQIA